MTAQTMKAVIFNGIEDVSIQDRPVPQVKDGGDVIVKVQYSALCGSELHVFRGHQKSATGFIMGHEFTGTIVEAGPEVKSFKVGDKIVCPFTISCGTCFYCKNDFSSRCQGSLLFGTPALDGGQAEFVRVPLAESTLALAPTGIDEKKLCLMADIFPTGYFAAKNALGDSRSVEDSVVVVIGCGPVGLCAVIAALEFKPKILLAVDSVAERLSIAKGIGAEPWNYQTQKDELVERVKSLTSGRGADAVIEVVGHSSALEMGFNLLRPWGIISSVGVHNGAIPWTGNQGYGKNLTVKMGRCPVRSVFFEALAIFEKKQHLLDFMTEKIMPLSQAVEGYEIFNAMRAHKVIFDVQG